MEIKSFKEFVLTEAKEETLLHDQLEEYAQDINVYFSFRSIDKVTQNKNIHDHSIITPTGVWAYHLKTVWSRFYEIGKNQNLNKIPFSKHENSINLFEVPSDMKLVTGKNYSEADYVSDQTKLLETYKDKIEDSNKIIKDSFAQYYNERIYRLTGEIAKLFPDSSKKWSSIIRELDYDGFVDQYGSGFISKQEKYISVIVNKSRLDFITKVKI